MSQDLWSLQADSVCKYPIAFLTDRSIGDMVCAMAALQVVAEKYEQMIVTTNIPQLLHPMATKNANYHLGWLPFHSQAEVFNISVGSAMNPRYGHPIKQILDHLGVESPAAIPQPFWNERTLNARFDSETNKWDVTKIAYPEYDFLLHVNSDDDDRRLDFGVARDLIYALLEEYPDCSIGILGSDVIPPWNHHKPDPRPFDDTLLGVREAEADGSIPERGPEYVYNRSFELVGSLVKRAKKAVITIDSSVSRIAHAVQCKNHVLLCPDAYPVEWSSHPGCYNVIGNPKTWTVGDVMFAVRHATKECNEYYCEDQYEMPKKRNVDASALWALRHLVGTWSLWPREGNLTLRLQGGFGCVGKDVDLTRLSQEQANHLVDLAQRTNLFDSISTAAEQTVQVKGAQ